MAKAYSDRNESFSFPQTRCRHTEFKYTIVKKQKVEMKSGTKPLKPSKPTSSHWDSAKPAPSVEAAEAASVTQVEIGREDAALAQLISDKSRKFLEYEEISRIGNQFEKFAVCAVPDSYSKLMIPADRLQMLLESMFFTFSVETMARLKTALSTDSSPKTSAADSSSSSQQIITFPVFVDWFPTIEALQRKQTLVQKCAPSSVDWAQLRQQLPCGISQAEHERREALFTKFDPNGNGFLSLAEIDKAIRDELRISQIFECKPVIMRAFQAARMSQPPSERNHSGDYVTRSTFRVLLYYLKEYFEMWQIFSAADTSGDRRVDKAEFAKIFEQLKSRWGLRVENKSADDVFREVDVNGGGFLLFDEFAHWALMNNLSDD